MRLESLELRDFRNYSRQTIGFEAGLNVVVGENAQGKSNLMEALFALSSTRSARTHREQEVIRWGETVARLAARLVQGSAQWTVELTWQFPGPRQSLVKNARINRQDVRRFSELFALVRMVLFQATDLELVTGSPNLRRRYLDYVLCKTDAVYLDALQQYTQVLKQRNEWLRHPAGGLEEVLTEQLCQWGRPLTERRAVAVAALSVRAADYYQAFTGADTPLHLSYASSVAEPHVFAARAAEELRRQTTVAGPHRDDVAILLGGEPMRSYGSRGQLRCAALALRLAEGDLMRETDGDAVIYLLDDCMSELDPQRQTLLWQHLLTRPQVVVTGTPDLLQHAPDAALHVYDLTGGDLVRRA